MAGFNKKGRVNLKVNINLTKISRTVKQIPIDNGLLREVGNIAVRCMEPYVPYATGNLRKSAKVTVRKYKDGKRASITYAPGPSKAANFPTSSAKSYAQYVYYGVVMGPNLKTRTGKYYSIPNQKKTLTGRAMVYHTTGTRDHWDEVIHPDGEAWGKFKKDVQEMIKKRAKELSNGRKN